MLEQALELAASDEVARATRTQVRSSRGIRGIATGDLARALDAAWRLDPPRLPDDLPLLDRLFATSWEHGLAAIGLTAALVPDEPNPVLATATRWLTDADDLVSADAIGWLLLGPARIAQGLGPESLVDETEPLRARAAVAAGLAWLPIPIEGPAAAAVRARLNQARAAWVSASDDAAVGQIATCYARHPDPHVQKGMRRLLRTWGTVSRDAAVQWTRAFPGGLPRLLADEMAKLTKKGG